MEEDANGARRSIDLETPTGRAGTAENVPLIGLNTNLSIKIHRVGQKYMRNLKIQETTVKPLPTAQVPHLQPRSSRLLSRLVPSVCKFGWSRHNQRCRIS